MTEPDLDDWYEEKDYHRLGVTGKQLDNLRAWQQGAKNPRERKRERSSERERSGGRNSRNRRGDFSAHGQADFQFDGENENE